MKNLLTITALTAVIMISPAVASADTGEKKVECKTGAYGTQTCTPVTPTPSAKPEKAPVRNTGVAENIMFATVAMLGLSTAGFVYAKNN